MDYVTGDVKRRVLSASWKVLLEKKRVFDVIIKL
jgi:hypothetical protein